jgi:predicted TIM-barrel fold metal-dependent hydrolase
MEANGLAKVVNLGTFEALGIPFREGTKAFRSIVGDRIIHFATPDFDDVAPGFGLRMADELERKVSLGARGLKIFKELGLRYRDHSSELIAVDDVRLDPLWDRAGSLGVPVLIHTADPLAFFLPLDESNERSLELSLNPEWHFAGPEFPEHDALLAQRNRVVERHPTTVFIGAHLGNYAERLDYVDDCLTRYPNFYVDISARISEIGRHPRKQAGDFFVKHQDRVIFGTDLTMGWDEVSSDPLWLKQFYDAHWRFFETRDQQVEYPVYPVMGDWKVDCLGLPESCLTKLYVANAETIIPGLKR